jgi:transposase
MRHALSETEWSIIQPILPNKPRGIVPRGTIRAYESTA